VRRKLPVSSDASGIKNSVHFKTVTQQMVTPSRKIVMYWADLRTKLLTRDVTAL